MPLARVPGREPISKPVFHDRMQRWFRDTDEPLVGDPDVDGRTPWVYIRDGGAAYKLHADTPRHAVADYLRLLRSAAGDLAWTTRLSRRGKPTAVADGSEVEVIESFYLYVHRPA